MSDFTGKKALITGAAGGIGRAIAERLHADGATVFLTDVSEERLDELKNALGGERVLTKAAALDDPAQIDALAQEAEAQTGGIDILVNNAGITKDNLFMRMKDEDFQAVMQVNLMAAFRLTRAIIRPMMKRRYGRIISLSSIVGVMGNAGQANYAASKAGLIAMTKCLASEVASRGITANCVAPGFVKTPMTDALPQEIKEKLAKSIPMQRLGLPQDIAGAVAFLAGEDASYITGQTLHVNGGLAMV